jgi:hypothetical protein
MGRWLIVAGLAAGLLLLAFGGRARGAEVTGCDANCQLLLAPELATDAERTSEAGDLLARDRNRKLADISSAAVDLGIHAAVAPSPFKILQSAAELARGLGNWSKRTPAEEQALLLMAPSARDGSLGDADARTYQRLERREREALVKNLLHDAESALNDDRLPRARHLVERAIELAPGSERADLLLDRIAARGELAVAPQASAVSGDVARWDVGVASALLTDGAPSNESLEAGPTADRELAHAVALHQSGARAEALVELRRIASGRGAAAERAAHMLEDPGVNPERALDAEIASYYKHRALGVAGGAELSSHGLALSAENVEFSYAGFRAWQGSYKLFRSTIDPVNIFIEAPVRALRDWRPDGADLRAAAERYLEAEPEGARAADAQAWLEQLSNDERKSPRVAPFQDGYLVLPRAHTRYGKVSGGRIVVARAALLTVHADLPSELGVDGAPSVIVTEQGSSVSASALSSDQSLALLSQLAEGLEQSALGARGGNDGEALEAIHRLDTRVRRGGRLAVLPHQAAAAAGLTQVGQALVDGASARTVADIRVSRNADSLVAARDIGSDDSLCLPQTPCIERKLPVDSQLFAHTDTGGDAGVGARAGFRQAQLSVELGTGGPHASLVLPIARWLGISHLAPVEAHVEVGLGGISAGPRVDSDPLEGAGRRL